MPSKYLNLPIAEDCLDEPLFVVRRNSEAKTLSALAHGYQCTDHFLVFLAAAAWGLIFWLLVGYILSVFVCGSSPIPPGSIWSYLFYASFFVGTIGVAWLMYREPRKSKLQVHRNGFKYRDKWMRYDDIRAIWTGRPRKWGEEIAYRLNRFVGRYLLLKGCDKAQIWALRREHARNTTVMFERRDGAMIVLNGMVLVFRDEDLRRFQDEARNRRPDLFEPMPCDTPKADGA